VKQFAVAVGGKITMQKATTAYSALRKTRAASRGWHWQEISLTHKDILASEATVMGADGKVALFYLGDNG
jgi:hypothetical protein